MKTKQILITLLTLWASAVANAYDACIDGIYYNFSGSDATVTFMKRGWDYNDVSYNRDAYSGNVTIPESVIYEDNSYKVKSIGAEAFSYCTGLTSVTIPNSVTSIGDWAFGDCTGLASITIPNSVTSIGYCAFDGCTGLTSVTIPNSVTSIGSYAFSGCSGLTSIVVKYGNTTYDSRDNCNAIIETATNTLIAGCNNTIIHESVTSIGNGAFSGCTVTSVTIPNSVTSIGNSAFFGCSGLTYVTIPNSVTSIGGEAFTHCESLAVVIIGNSVTSIGNYAFEDCENLKAVVCFAVNVPATGDHLTFNEEDVRNSTLYVPDESLDAYKARSPWYYFGTIKGFNEAEEFAVDNIYYKITSNAAPNTVAVTFNAANYESYLNEINGSITIPNSVSYNGKKFNVTSIGDFAFTGCRGLRSITIPNSVTEIGDYAFEGCSGLVSVTIPNSVTEIGDYAFEGCTGLTSVTIPKNVTSIGMQAFEGCHLFDIHLTSITPPETRFGGSDDKYFSFDDMVCNHAKLYIPMDTREKYVYDKNSNWYKFIHIYETATSANEAACTNASMLMDVKSFNYAIYDAVNNRLKMVPSSAVDESNPNHSWQTLEVDGKKFLYNIGAKKFAVPATDGSSFTFSDTVGSITMTDSENGIVLNGHTETEWALVSNEHMSTDLSLENIVVTGVKDIVNKTMRNGENEKGIYDLSGRKVDTNSQCIMHNSQLKKGIYIVNGKKTIVK